ncbi:prepilin peptidase [Caldovatus aquaticus]|uniref:Prepilin peptidase n=1 Tax=Caldovatus aquaticus TaxID=2865671 RepID=A0ABS7F2P8_9PROT|nr:prepilin peptidase [Caldovatus aquaticus]MBW8269080.1 prepilin peptidase [Caldovatus aquaticus]
MLTLAALATALLLAVAAWRDVATRLIPDGICAAIAVLGLAQRLAEGMPALLATLAAALALFLFLLLLAMAGAMGGGDLKLATATALALPPIGIYHLIVTTALAGGVLALIYLALARMLRAPAAGGVASPARRGTPLLRRVLIAETRRLRRRGPLPYGVAIAAGGMLVLFRSVGT